MAPAVSVAAASTDITADDYIVDETDVEYTVEFTHDDTGVDVEEFEVEFPSDYDPEDAEVVDGEVNVQDDGTLDASASVDGDTVTVTLDTATNLDGETTDFDLSGIVNPSSADDYTIEARTYDDSGDLLGGTVGSTVTIESAPLEVSNLDEYDNRGYDSKDTIDVTFSADIALPGSPSDYDLDYEGRDISVDSLSVDEDTVELTIPDQSLKEPVDGGEFTVEVDTSNVKGEDGQTVDPDSNTETEEVSEFVDSGDVDIDSAETTSTTTIDVQFNVALDTETIEASDFVVGSGDDEPESVDTSNAGVDGGLVELTMADEMDTDATPDVDVDNVDDLAENTITEDFTETTDGVAPVMESAITGDDSDGDSSAYKTVLVTFSEPIDTSLDEDYFSVDGATVDSVSDTEEVTLTLEEELDTDATPGVTLEDTVEDDDGNELSSASVTDTEDGLSPYLKSVAWSDENDSGSVDAGDELELFFSEAIKDGTLLENLDNHTFGTGAEVADGGTDSPVVTLASGNDISAGDNLTPTTSVLDASTNENTADNGVSAAVESAKTVLTVPTDYDIQGAVDIAQEGATIEVTGDYDAEDDATINVNKAVTIKAADGAEPVIDLDISDPIFSIEADVTLEGLEIEAPDAKGNDADTVLNQGGGELTIKDSTIHAYGGTAGMQFALESNEPVYVENTTFVGTESEGSAADDTGKAVWLDTVEPAGSTFDNVTVKQIDVGIQTQNVSDISVTNSTFEDVYAEAVIFAAENGNAIDTLSVTESSFSNVGQGVYFFSDGATDTAIEGEDLLVNWNSFEEIGTDYAEDLAVGTGTEEDWDGSGEISGTVDATENWWGDKTGPSISDADPQGSGASADSGDDIKLDPWLGEFDELLGNLKAWDIDTSEGWQMLSVNFVPAEAAASEVFSTKTGALFAYDPVDNVYVNATDEDFDIDPVEGYWLYESSVTEGFDLGDGMDVKQSVEFTLEEQGWHMIGSPLDVGWGQVTVNPDDEDVSVATADEQGIMSNKLWTYDVDDEEEGDYLVAQAPGGTIEGKTGYWVKTEEADVTLELPLSAPEEPEDSSVANSLTAQGFEAAPEGAETPPAPPSVQGASGELKANAAVTSEGVTFEVTGADVQSINVKVFSADGAEIFSNSASGDNLSWDADVANGVYLYGVSAEVDGEVKPLGIQKLLILE